MRPNVRKRLLAGAVLLPAIGMLSSGCLGYPAEGLVATPTAPGENAPSRLPQLLSQLQGGSAGLELLDGTTNQVLAAQDGATTTPGATSTPPNAKGNGSSATPATPTQPGTTSTPSSRPLEPGPTNPPNTTVPTAVPTDPPATATPTATATATPTATPPPATPTPTATPTIPSEVTPPTE